MFNMSNRFHYSDEKSFFFFLFIFLQKKKKIRKNDFINYYCKYWKIKLIEKKNYGVKKYFSRKFINIEEK